MHRYDDLYEGMVERPPDVAPFWRIACYPIVVRDGRVLMVEPVWAKRWELPGGGVEAGFEETLAEAAERECFEETGFRVQADPASLAYEQETFFSLAREGAYFHSLIFTVVATVVDDSPQGWTSDSGEIRRVAWIDLGTTEEGIHPIHHQALVARGLVLPVSGTRPVQPRRT
jgi:8-oxo-dGTP pyrophosphatase MutT (NUDIX family)